jgi:hypothetical protein
MLWVKAAAGFLIDNIGKFNYQNHIEKLCLKEECIGMSVLPFKLGRYENVSKSNFSDHVERIDLQNIQDNQGMVQAPQQGQPINMNHSPFRLFIESLLPWMNVPQADQDPNMPVIE